jgi:hypothetical protein
MKDSNLSKEQKTDDSINSKKLTSKNKSKLEAEGSDADSSQAALLSPTTKRHNSSELKITNDYDPLHPFDEIVKNLPKKKKNS